MAHTGRVLPPARNLSGIRWAVDVHVIDLEEAGELRRLGQLGWVYLQVADTTIIEVLGAQDPDNRDRLLDAVEPFPVLMGPAVLDHSVFGMAVVGSDDDSSRLRHVYSVLWPNNSFTEDGAMATAAGRTRFRDAMHVATSVRYALDGFVTNDQRVLGRADELAAAFSGFRVMSVAVATETAYAAVEHVRRQVKRGQEIAGDGVLPTWPETANGPTGAGP